MTGKRKAIAIAGGAIAGVLIAASVFAVRLQPWARQTLIDSLTERYKADVELGELKVALLPLPRVTGENLLLRPHGGQPMIRVRRFTAEILSPHHVRSVRLEGLDVTLPAHRDQPSGGSRGKMSVAIDEVVADGARLTTTPKDPSKEPLVFDIHNLTLRRVGPEDAMTFHGELTNPRPKGLIHVEGTFGPWNADDPAASLLEGKYTFHNADLAVFRGITGTLGSEGIFKGEVRSLEVHGLADVPNFALRSVNHPVPLHTEFSANVDGTDGDTTLHQVRARLGKSDFEVSGAIENGDKKGPKTIALQTKGGAGHLEDYLRLAMKSPKAPMTGIIRFQSKIRIPPGDIDIVDKLELDGDYSLENVRFTNADTEQKISSLSHHAEGEPNNQTTGATAAIHGRFELRSGTMHLPSIDFRVPGAVVRLEGTYEMRGGALNFSGSATLDATISQMTTGVKKILLKPIDPLFKRNKAGAVLPIKVSGTPGSPSFTFDIGRVLGGKQEPH